MIFNRNKQLSILDKLYTSTENQVAIFYSQYDSDIEDIVKEFIKDKDYFYYKAMQVSEEEQIKLFVNSINKQLSKSTISEFSYSAALKVMQEDKCEKRVVVVNEFQHIIKYSKDFIEEVLKCVHNKWGNQPVLFLLVSQNAYFVENQMVEKISELAYDISGLIKLSDVSFVDIVRYFDKYSSEDLVITYGITSGKCKRIESFDPSLSLKDNIIKNILNKDSYLFNRGLTILPPELREHSVYNTILVNLAAGNNKLNDLHRITGFSRAKISVYMNNLIEHNLIEKLDSIDSLGKDNALKGIYSIKDGFLSFFYRFIFPNISILETTDEELFYKKYIGPYISEIGEAAYKKVCLEYLLILNKMGKLPIKVKSSGKWFGKVGNIDIVLTDENGRNIIGYCEFSKECMSYEDYEWLCFCVKQAKISDDIYYLFSKKSFDERIIKEAEKAGNIYLIDSSIL